MKMRDRKRQSILYILIVNLTLVLWLFKLTKKPIGFLRIFNQTKEKFLNKASFLIKKNLVYLKVCIFKKNFKIHFLI